MVRGKLKKKLLWNNVIKKMWRKDPRSNPNTAKNKSMKTAHFRIDSDTVSTVC
jgi:hypothetical protein